MSEDNNEGFESGLRWLAQQVERSVEHLQEMDLDQIARAAGVDVDRAQEFLDGAGQWLNSQAEGLAGEAGLRFSGLSDLARRCFRQENAELLSVEYWLDVQQKLQRGDVPALRMYPDNTKLHADADR